MKPAVLFDEKGLHVLTCKSHNGGRNKWTIFAPKSPHGHILNAKRCDQLSHFVKMSRAPKHVVAKAHCTTFSMVQCCSGDVGVDNMSTRTYSDFNFASEPLAQHEAASIVGRRNINIVLSQKVSKGQMSPLFAESVIQDAKGRFSMSHLRKCAQGAACIGFEDVIATQLCETSENQQLYVVNPNGKEFNEKSS